MSENCVKQPVICACGKQNSAGVCEHYNPMTAQTAGSIRGIPPTPPSAPPAEETELELAFQYWMGKALDRNRQVRALRQRIADLEKEYARLEEEYSIEVASHNETTARADASESVVEEMRKALEEASNLLFQHHELGFIRRTYEQHGGKCELCSVGIFEKHEELLSRASALKREANGSGEK